MRVCQLSDSGMRQERERRRPTVRQGTGAYKEPNEKRKAVTAMAGRQYGRVFHEQLHSSQPADSALHPPNMIAQINMVMPIHSFFTIIQWNVIEKRKSFAF